MPMRSVHWHNSQKTQGKPNQLESALIGLEALNPNLTLLDLPVPTYSIAKADDFKSGVDQTNRLSESWVDYC